MTTAYYLWEDVKPEQPASSGPGADQPDLGHLLDQLCADMSASIQQWQGLRRGLGRGMRQGLTLRRWVRRIAFAHGD